MGKNIEKSNIPLGVDDMLKKLDEKVKKQTPEVPKPEKNQEASISKKEMQKAVAENDALQKENADKYLEKWLVDAELNKESLAANESENKKEKALASKTKTLSSKGQNVAIDDFNLPEGATENVTNNRIDAANAPLNTMLAATWLVGWVFKKVFRFSESDIIPENLA